MKIREMTIEQYREYRRKWREKNAERVREYERKYWANNSIKMKIQRIERQINK